jgi:hypothetical protein
LNTFLLSVLTAVESHDQEFLARTKVDDKVSNRKLPPEFHAAKSGVTQARPEPSFSVSLISSEPSRLFMNK